MNSNEKNNTNDFIFKGTKKWQLVQIGNAVPPLLGKAIALSVKKGLEGAGICIR